MKKKILKKSVHLSVLMALAVAGNAAMAEEQYGVLANTKLGTQNLNSETDQIYESYQYGVSAAGRSPNSITATVTAPNLTFKVVNGNKTKTIYGAYAQGSGGIYLGNEDTGTLNIFVTNDAYKDKDTVRGTGIKTASNSLGVTLLGEDITVNTKAKGIATVVDSQGKVSIGSEISTSVTLIAESSVEMAYGINAGNDKTQVNVDGKSVFIGATSSKSAYGINSEEAAQVNVHGIDVVIEVNSKKAAYGSNSVGTSSISIGKSDTERVKVKALSSSSSSSVYGIRNSEAGAEQTILGKSIVVSTNALYNTNGIYNGAGGKVIVGDDNTQSVDVLVQNTGKGETYAVYNANGLVGLNANGSDSKINISAQGTEAVMGVYAKGSKAQITLGDRGGRTFT